MPRPQYSLAEIGSRRHCDCDKSGSEVPAAGISSVVGRVMITGLAAACLLLAAPQSMHATESEGTLVRQFDPVTNSWVRKKVSVEAISRRLHASPIPPEVVRFDEEHSTGTIVVDTGSRYLYLVLGGGIAKRYAVGVGREGFEWKGVERISRKAEWPSWTPPAEMIRREERQGRFLPLHMEGGPENPLGARALYLGSTQFRIHGTNEPWTIGRAVSSGCIRMANDDVIELYDQVRKGTKVVVR